MRTDHSASEKPKKTATSRENDDFAGSSLPENGRLLPGEKLPAAKIGAGRRNAGGNYVPLPWRALKPDTVIPFNVYFKLPSHKQSMPEYSLCCQSGQIFKSAWCLRLQKLGVDVIYFSRMEKAKVNKYLGYDPEHIAVAPKVPSESPTVIPVEMPDLIEKLPKEIFDQLRSRTGHHLDLALDHLDEFFEAINKEGVILSFIRDLWQHDQSLFVHSSNACLLGLAFTSHLGWPKKEVHAFRLGVLLHDVGMTQVPRHILRKTGKLTREEWELIIRHPDIGYKMLKNFAGLDRTLLRMVREHHENGDGSGYPQGLDMADIQPRARVLRIVDSYEAMTTKRRWRQAWHPKDAIWEIRRGWEQSRIYDPSYLKDFIKFLGGW